MPLLIRDRTVLYWRWSTDGRFTVKSAYSALRDGGTKDARTSRIWSLRLSLKVKVFCWLLLKKRLLTADNLVKRELTDNTKCMLCGLEEETVNHLFTQCIITRFLMVTTQEDVQLGDLGEEVPQVWDRWVGRTRTHPIATGLTGIIACWWVSWESRNKAIFGTTQSDPSVGIYKIKQLTDLWRKLSPVE
uniref:Reverse transcriptase zinc-binding domain-containing protein n=1 Tax=Ananas comosus var. bracteatus TaxID=296719 RepID=A0A6V7P8K2_ANACO|nr:unnamed protein product [Ananas comosus var. bracteatus]